MTIGRLKSATIFPFLVITLSSCGDQVEPEALTASPSVSAPAVQTPALPPVLNKAGVTFLPVTDLAPIVEGARISVSEIGGFKFLASKTLSGYQVGATLPTDKVDHVVVRYQIGQTTESGVVGILAGDGSRWLTSSKFGRDSEGIGELTAAVTEKSVRFVIETSNGVGPFEIEKLEWAAFCAKPPSRPDAAPIAEQCYPKLEPTFAFDGVQFAKAPALTPWASDAKVAAGDEGTVTIVPSATTSGYQASVEIAKGASVAVAVKYELDGSVAVGSIGILRGDASAWVATASFGPGKPQSGQITALMEEGGVKLVVESAAGVPPIKFRKLEFAPLCETKPAQGLVAATVSACP